MLSSLYAVVTTTIRFRFDDHSTAYQRSLRSSDVTRYQQRRELIYFSRRAAQQVEWSIDVKKKFFYVFYSGHVFYVF